MKETKVKKAHFSIGAALVALSLSAASAEAKDIAVLVKVPVPGDVRLWDPPHEKIFAQDLLERIKARHPNVFYMGIHATPPVLEDDVIIASSSDNNIVGLSSDQGIDSFARRNREFYSFHNVNGVAAKHFGPGNEGASAYLKLMSRDGKNLGLLIAMIHTQASTPVGETYAEFQAIQKEFAAEIADKDALFMANGHLAPGKEH